MPRRCPVCKSKEWHKQPSSGLLICSEGHVLQNYRNETSERTELGPHVLKQRRMKSLKNSGQFTHEDETVYYGPQARYLYFEALQLILRMQISSLIKEWNLPAEFELICRDLWTLHLDSLQRFPQPEPYLSRRGDGSSSHADNMQAKEAIDSSSESEEDDSMKTQAFENELAQLLEEMSDTDLFDENVDTDLNGIAAVRRNLRNTFEIPAGNIAILMLGCWTLRIPVMYVDFIRLIEAYKLPYLEAVRLLPEEMTKHLTQANKNNLSPYTSPSVLGLHKLTSRLAKNIRTTNGIHSTEMNVGKLLWRIVKRMGGNATVYNLAKMMAMELNLPLTVDLGLAPELTRKRRLGGKRMNSDNLPVEVSLMGALIIVLKLKYDFQSSINASDGREEEPGFELLTHQGEVVYLDCGKELAMNELTDEEMEGYLGFCERALLSQRKEDKTVSEFFLNWKMINDQNTTSSHHTADKVATIRMVDHDHACRRISIFHFADSLGTVPEPYSSVLGVSARLVGIGLKEMGAVVERFERRLVRFRDRDPE